jgi:predicted nucleic acid-binding protein
MNSAGGSTEKNTVRRPKVYLDTDVLLAAAGSTTGASHLVLKLSELTLIEGVISEAVRVEAERNLTAKLSHALPAYRALLKSAKLREAPLPLPDQLKIYHRQADPKDLPHLVAACLAGCHYLITHNTRHYRPKPGIIEVLNPGAFLERIRQQLSGLVP